MNIIFLDIDGVLQPYDAECRYLIQDKQIINRLSLQFGVDYSKYSFEDVISVVYDWDYQAISRLKYILEQTNSKIIVSSNWRRKNQLYKMRDLLKIQGLDKYWLDDTPIDDDKTHNTLALKRYHEIMESLKKYEINNYAILDDEKELFYYYPNNLILTNNIISIQNMNDAIKVLKRSN